MTQARLFDLETSAPESAAAMRRARFLLAYDGASFHGFAENRDVRTVLGELRGALERVVRTPLELAGAGRTDAGVHAWGQVVSGDLPDHVDLADLSRRVNRMLAGAIVVRAAAWADSDFHARFSAVSREYRYHVLNAAPANPFAGGAWHVTKPLALWALRAGCDGLIGEHDFRAFCRIPKVAAGHEPPSMVRRVLHADWEALDDDQRPGLLRFTIRANAFCHQMVRSIVGCLVRVGAGELTPGDVPAILRRGDRAAASQIAPPHGLCLWKVGYDPELSWPACW